MENRCMSNEVYANEGIKITIPLTGKVLPTEFKNMICDSIASDFSRVISDDLLVNEYINAEIKRGDIALVLILKADGTFTDDLVLEYKSADRPCRTTYRTFKPYEIPRDYVTLYRKKALRILKRRIEKGLKQFAPLNSDCD